MPANIEAPSRRFNGGRASTHPRYALHDKRELTLWNQQRHQIGAFLFAGMARSYNRSC